jgi:hypothetical protein
MSPMLSLSPPPLTSIPLLLVARAEEFAPACSPPLSLLLRQGLERSGGEDAYDTYEPIAPVRVALEPAETSPFMDR